MRHFHVGDYVRIFGLSGSQWDDREGIIVEIFEHGPYEQGQIRQECAVDVGGERHWFMDRHLVKTAPVALIRFYRAEVLARWQLEPSDVGSLNSNPRELVALLRDRFNFAPRRAHAEVDDFVTAFNERIAQAVEPNNSSAKNAA